MSRLDTRVIDIGDVLGCDWEFDLRGLDKLTLFFVWVAYKITSSYILIIS